MTPPPDISDPHWFAFLILLALILGLTACATAPGIPCYSPYPFLDCGFAR